MVNGGVALHIIMHRFKKIINLVVAVFTQHNKIIFPSALVSL